MYVVTCALDSSSYRGLHSITNNNNNKPILGFPTQNRKVLPFVVSGDFHTDQPLR